MTCIKPCSHVLALPGYSKKHPRGGPFSQCLLGYFDSLELLAHGGLIDVFHMALRTVPLTQY